jgi:hypothetical protein
MENHMDHNSIWTGALARLQREMTRATFDAWLQGTTATGLSDQTITIEVRNAAALDWLGHRMKPVIERTLHELGHPLQVAFTVPLQPPLLDQEPATNGNGNGKAESLQPAAAAPAKIPIELVEFDPTRRGWIQVSAYAIQFWRPYLSPGPFDLWETIRSYARDGECWPSIQTLADIVADGNKQMLIGRMDKGKRREGWLEKLERERIVWSHREGQSYSFRVLDNLPLLTTTQVATLSERRQQAHARFLEKANLDRADWEQATVPTFTKG